MLCSYLVFRLLRCSMIRFPSLSVTLRIFHVCVCVVGENLHTFLFGGDTRNGFASSSFFHDWLTRGKGKDSSAFACCF